MISSLTGYRDPSLRETRIPVGGTHLGAERDPAQQRSPSPHGDDDAGLSLAARMAAKVREEAHAQKEQSDGASQLQAALGGLSLIHRHLQQLREVSLRAVAGRSIEHQRQTQTTVHDLLLLIDRAADDARCGDAPLLHQPLTLLLPMSSDGAQHSGARSIELPATDSASLGLLSLRTDSLAAAQAALATVDSALATVAATRARVSELHGKLAAALTPTAPAAALRPAAILDAPPQATAGQANQDPQVALELLRANPG